MNLSSLIPVYQKKTTTEQYGGIGKDSEVCGLLTVLALSAFFRYHHA